MLNNARLNLLVIDDDQLYAERLVGLLSSYYDKVNLGFLDDQEELVKALRHQWDVLVFGRAYDMSFTEVVAIVQEHEIDLPIIGLMSDELASQGRNADGLPAVLNGTMVKAILAEKDTQVVMAICLLHANLTSRQHLKSLHHVLLEAEQRANILIKNSKSAVAYLDQGIHIFANDPYLELFGFENSNDIIGVPVIDMIAGGDNVKAFKQFLSNFNKGSRTQVEFMFESLRPNGTTFAAKLQLASATLEGAPVTQVIIQQNNANSAEVAERLAAAERQDSLTGLSNRRGFEERLEQLYQRAVQDKLSSALLYIQLDNIGKISSSLGLQGIDATIKQVGYVLEELITDGHISRFSDTAFTVLVEDLTTQMLIALAEQILAVIGKLYIEVDTRTTNTTASIGIVKIEPNGTEPKILLERAIESISRIKTESPNQGDAYHLYDPNEHASSDDTALAESLNNAISHNGFELLYQPIYDIDADRSDFFEVYLRLPLNDADNTVLTPDNFMAVARVHNLREKIDRWLLINACKQLSEVRKLHPQARIIVSLTSGSMVDKKLPNIASQLINALGGATGALTLQFNEQDVVNYLTVAKLQFAALKQAGCQVSIHNFGTTAKSIEVAGFVQPDMVRLARTYVNSLNNADELDTVKTLIARVKALHSNVLIPYIEEAAIMSASWSVGARYLQGYYLEEPSKTMTVTVEQQ
ncbi:EAL domain-containing protein [Psychrobacter sp. 16-MNA-CIBAN-0192]|uniref:EAL domain-containing protein n=1 Tax=Psychrobacter sp. 16-MNA-CIBAN-0192 TaxID=3140448 RepID=UPI003323D241